MGTTTLRVSTENRDRVNRLRQQGESVDEVIGKALDTLERDRFWDQYRHQLAATTPDERATEAREADLWERAALADLSGTDGES